MSIFSLIPTKYKWIGGIVLAISLIGGAYSYGYHKGYMRADAVIADYEKKKALLANEISEIQVQIHDRIITKYVDRYIKIKQTGDNNAKVAKDNVPDHGFVSFGWVYTHDAAARGDQADATSAANETSSGVEANNALATIAENYAICRATREQLIELQDWVSETVDNLNNNGKSKK